MYQNYNDINKLFYPYNKSIINNLFFFEFQTSYICPSCKYNENQIFIKCILDLELDKKSNLKANKNLTIYDFLNLDQYLECIKCHYNCLYKRKICKLPKLLILVIKLNERKNIKFRLHEEIDISNNLPAKKQYIQSKYQLISAIINNSITYCKSMESNVWYKYGDNVRIVNSINDNLNNVPYLLIYKQKPIKTFKYYK